MITATELNRRNAKFWKLNTPWYTHVFCVWKRARYAYTEWKISRWPRKQAQ